MTVEIRGWRWCIYSVYESSSAGTRQNMLSFRVKGKESTSRNLNLRKCFTKQNTVQSGTAHVPSQFFLFTPVMQTGQRNPFYSPVYSHCTLTRQRVRWRPEVEPAPTASLHSGGCSTGWTMHAHISHIKLKLIHTFHALSYSKDIPSALCFLRINTHLAILPDAKDSVFIITELYTVNFPIVSSPAHSTFIPLHVCGKENSSISCLTNVTECSPNHLYIRIQLCHLCLKV